jgi:hypothetical protein
LTRISQPRGERGNLRWIQEFVNERPAELDTLILPGIGGASSIEWRSPLADDDFAEYRDNAFLDRLGVGDLASDLARFWPKRGPQWDGLATSDRGDLILVEAKAHVAEICSPGSAASAPSSRDKIERALAETAAAIRAKPRAPWADVFYQYANRLAHLDFLRRVHGRPAWLVFVYFVGDAEMHGPESEAEWRAALKVMKHVMGLSEGHPLSRYVIDVFPPVRGNE